MGLPVRDQFAHLHVHTEYSLLDGAAKLTQLTEYAAELGQPAVAMTDHGNLMGAHSFWKAANAAGVKPIIGEEFYVAPGSRTDKSAIFWGPEDGNRRHDVSGSGAYTHLTVVAASSAGLRNLYRLHHLSNSEGFYRKPRIDRQLLEEHSEGLIVLSGCLGSELQTRLKLGQHQEATDYIDWGKQVFGDRFYVEIMEHGLEEEKVINPLLREQAAFMGVHLVATNDSHFVAPKDAGVHDALLCVQTRAKLSDKNRFRFDGQGYYLMDRAEMEATGLPSGALNNTLVVAERVEKYDNFDHTLRMPKSNERDEAEALRAAVYDALLGAPDEYWVQADYELDTICSLGYAGYFLILHSVIRTAKARGIRVGPGRGSAGGSVVAFLLDITELDPLRHGLLFERFLNPQRASLPDVDIDVAEHQRLEFLEIVREYAGDGFVATIGTTGTIGAKAALHDAARVLGYPRHVSNDLVSLLPRPVFGKQPTLADADFSGQAVVNYSDVIITAEGLEGLVRSQGQHAAGVIISPDHLPELLPLWKQTGKGHDITSFDMKSVEELGFVKFDFLGLRNLTVVDATLKMIGKQWEDLPRNPEDCNDAATYRLLASGKTLGVFQLDSPGMQKLLKKMKPTQFEDIAAALALYRPGPIAQGAHETYGARKNVGC